MPLPNANPRATSTTNQDGQGNKMNQNPNLIGDSGAITQGQALTGGKGDDVKKVVDERRTGQSQGNKKPSKDQPNRNKAENGVDLDEKSETNSHRQGNAYGVSHDSAANFRDDAIRRIAELKLEIKDYEDEAKKWNDSLEGTKFYKKEI